MGILGAFSCGIWGGSDITPVNYGWEVSPEFALHSHNSHKNSPKGDSQKYYLLLAYMANWPRGDILAKLGNLWGSTVFSTAAVTTLVPPPKMPLKTPTPFFSHLVETVSNRVFPLLLLLLLREQNFLHLSSSSSFPLSSLGGDTKWRQNVSSALCLFFIRRRKKPFLLHFFGVPPPTSEKNPQGFFHLFEWSNTTISHIFNAASTGNGKSSYVLNDTARRESIICALCWRLDIGESFGHFFQCCISNGCLPSPP